MDSFVSIIMPAYNAELYIEETIDSILNQTYKNWELIIIDDGSRDKTKLLIERYKEKDNRIFYFYQENGKQGRARNKGLRSAKGSLVAFIDADDLWLPDKLEKQVSFMLQNPEVDLIFSDCYIFKQTPISGSEEKMNIKPATYAGELGFKAFLQKNRIPILTSMVRMKALEKVEYFNESVEVQNAEDYFLWCELLLNGFVFKAMPDVLAAYRKHENAVTANSNGSALRQVLEVQAKLLELHPEHKHIIMPQFKSKILSFISFVRNEGSRDYISSLYRVFKISGLKKYVTLFWIVNLLGWKETNIRLAYFVINRML